MSALLLGAVLVLHEPIRHQVLVIVRFPFTLTQALVATLVTLPRLPVLSRENAALQSQLLQRELELVRLREELRHAAEARALAAVSPSTEGIVASVIARSTLPTQQTVLLDRGGRDGLTLESVIVDAGGVIGRVAEVHARSCLVVLLTDPESRVAGLVERSRETGLLVGRGTGLCEFVYLDADADLQEGDRILTAGLGGAFPKGLVLGRVVRLVRDQESGTAWAQVEPAAHLGRAEEVLCLPPAAPAVEPRDVVRPPKGVGAFRGGNGR